MLARESNTAVFLNDVTAEERSRSIGLSGFQIVSPRFKSDQNSVLRWLAAAHARSGDISFEMMQKLVARYSASPSQIGFRSHELEDFTHLKWGEMLLYGRESPDIAHKTAFFDQTVDSIFERLYPSNAKAPSNIIHVTCTGYSAPSGAQRLVSKRQWGEMTQVLHAYHMGCYAAHPALRMAGGLVAASPDSEQSVDIVHTELCTLHLDPTNHDPAQLVIQSLFADGFIKYQIGSLNGHADFGAHEAFLEVLATRDVIVPDSANAMRWVTGPFVYEMTLSKEVPTLFAAALPAFVSNLFEEAGLDFEEEAPAAVFAIHPGGPTIIERSALVLGLNPEQTFWSREVLRDHGNMSSATLPHIWKNILEDPTIPNGTLIVSIGAGPGLTLSGALFRKLAI